MIIVMEGYNIPQGLSTKVVIDGKVVYPGIAAGITGTKKVSFKAHSQMEQQKPSGLIY